jgi:hypothetical protein
MDRAQADALLLDVELIPAAEGAISQARELERRLLAQDIPVALARPPPRACCGSGCACGTKLQVLVREEDVPRLSQLLHQEWLEAVQQEGTLGDGLTPQPTTPVDEASAELACPACGFRGPLVEGACGDCGLQLE